MNQAESGSHPAEETDPDIVLVMLASVRRHVQLTPEQEAQIEREIRSEHGGMRVRIPKRGKHLRPEKRREVFRQALSDTPEREILDSNGISRSTLYRLMKRGGE